MVFILCYLSHIFICRNRIKIAKVIPLYKYGDKYQFTNYRPVSLLPQFSKIIEKLFIKRLDIFLDKKNVGYLVKAIMDLE